MFIVVQLYESLLKPAARSSFAPADGVPPNVATQSTHYIQRGFDSRRDSGTFFWIVGVNDRCENTQYLRLATAISTDERALGIGAVRRSLLFQSTSSGDAGSGIVQ